MATAHGGQAGLFALTVAVKVPYVKVADRVEGRNWGKVLGPCPAAPETAICSDVRSRHHTVLVGAGSADEAADAVLARDMVEYVVRVERQL